MAELKNKKKHKTFYRKQMANVNELNSPTESRDRQNLI